MSFCVAKEVQRLVVRSPLRSIHGNDFGQDAEPQVGSGYCGYCKWGSYIVLSQSWASWRNDVATLCALNGGPHYIIFIHGTSTPVAFTGSASHTCRKAKFYWSDADISMSEGQSSAENK